MTLTSQERISRILSHRPVDRIGLFEVFWPETVQQWTKDGKIPPGETIEDHFNQDLRRTSGGNEGRLLNLTADPDAEETVVEETATTRLVRDGNGALLRWFKGRSASPEHVDFAIKERARLGGTDTAALAGREPAGTSSQCRPVSQGPGPMSARPPLPYLCCRGCLRFDVAGVRA